MQVYKIIPNISYSYGCALVAANSEQEAINVYVNDSEENKYCYSYYECDCTIVNKLTYDCSKPTIIFDNFGGD